VCTRTADLALHRDTVCGYTQAAATLITKHDVRATSATPAGRTSAKCNFGRTLSPRSRWNPLRNN
jgi:hypothetical protein